MDFVEDSDTNCWIWQRHILPGGYGVLSKEATTAHRHYYEQYVGSVPEGYDVHHICNVRACVNPGHLEPMARRPHRRLDRRTKLNLQLAREIKATTGDATPVAARYGISRELVYGIRHGRKWPDA